MITQFVLLLPGQGSQKVGMGRDLHDSFSSARDTFQSVDDAIGANLSSLAFNGPSEELTLTHNAQPALLAHSAAAWSVIKDAVGAHVVAAAGHSLGEFSAYHVSGALTVSAAARIVRKRGSLMFETGVTRPGAMAAVLGTLTDGIDAICAQASRERGMVVPANYNSEEQVVISGEVAGVERAMELAREAGAKRCLPLPVSGAFHSPLMEPAVSGLQAALDEERWDDPKTPVFANVNAQPVADAATARQLLVRQLTAPVRWLETVRNLATRFPDALFVELGTGAVLSGLVKRIAPGVKTATCGTVAEVEGIIELSQRGD